MEGSNERALKGVGYNFFAAADISRSDDGNDEDESYFDRRVAAVIAAAFAEDNDFPESTTVPVIPNLNLPPPPSCPNNSNNKRRRRRSQPIGGGRKYRRPAFAGGAAANGSSDRTERNRQDDGPSIASGLPNGSSSAAEGMPAVEGSSSNSMNDDDECWGDDAIAAMPEDEFDRYVAAAAAAAAASGGDSVRRLHATSFRRAAQYLHEANCRGGGAGVTTELSLSSHMGVNNNETDKRESFAHFVRELEKDACHLRTIEFHTVDWRGLPDHDLDDLFGRVLPALRNLECIELHDSTRVARRLPDTCLARLASDLPRNSMLSHLRWMGGRIDHDAARAIAGMIRRNPSRLAHLELLPPRRVGLGKDELKTVCDAVRHNTHLLEMRLRAHQVYANSLNGALGPSSPLRRLHVFSDKAYFPLTVVGLANQLKTNTTLTHLYLYKESIGPEPIEDLMFDGKDDEYAFSPLRDVLQTCNFTLQVLEAPVYLDVDGSEIELPDGVWSENQDVTRLLDRNERIGRVLKALKVVPSSSSAATPTMTALSLMQGRTHSTGPSTTTEANACLALRPPQPQSYHVKAVGMWPHYMEVTNDVPTPLYRLLRHGALQDVCHCLWERANSRGWNKKKKRGRS